MLSTLSFEQEMNYLEEFNDEEPSFIKNKPKRRVYTEEDSFSKKPKVDRSKIRETKRNQGEE